MPYSLGKAVVKSQECTFNFKLWPFCKDVSILTHSQPRANYPSSYQCGFCIGLALERSRLSLRGITLLRPSSDHVIDDLRLDVLSLNMHPSPTLESWYKVIAVVILLSIKSMRSMNTSHFRFAFVLSDLKF